LWSCQWYLELFWSCSRLAVAAFMRATSIGMKLRRKAQVAMASNSPAMAAKERLS